MLRASAQILTRHTTQETKCGSSAFALEFVRWRRKPRWLPTAKSKMFRVPKRPEQDPEEKAELMRLHNNYKTQLRSVRQFLRLETLRLQETSTAHHYMITPEQEEAEFKRRLQINEEWNKNISAVRELRLTKQMEDRAAYIKERLELKQIREDEQLERIEALVKKEKELSKHYITPDKVDGAIVEALANPVDHNFCIDLKGQIYCGRSTVPGSSGTPANKDGENSRNEKEHLEATN